MFKFIKMFRATLAGYSPSIVARRSVKNFLAAGYRIGLTPHRYKLS